MAEWSFNAHPTPLNVWSLLPRSPSFGVYNIDMPLVLGTEDGVYHADVIESAEPEKVVGTGRVMRVRRFAAADGVYACSKTGLYRSKGETDKWSTLGVPRQEVYSVVVSPGGERLYVGTHPAHLYVSENDGDSWRELDGFQELPSRDEWHTPRHRNEAHVRSLGVHPDAPDRVVAGVEVGGVHVSEDCGETWTERRDGVHGDVHHVVIAGPDEFVASCGDGLYRTHDAGQSWLRLDTELSHRYFREAFVHDGQLVAAAARGPPGTWDEASGADAALFVSGDDGETFTSISYPGESQEVVLAWTTKNGELLAGTNEGRVLREEDDGWKTIGKIPVGIRSLCAI